MTSRNLNNFWPLSPYRHAFYNQDYITIVKKVLTLPPKQVALFENVCQFYSIKLIFGQTFCLPRFCFSNWNLVERNNPIL